MPITDVTIDRDELTISVVAEYPVPVRRVWDAYLDPRQLEKFWGPPAYPATFFRHDGFAEGRSDYTMIGPEGDRSSGLWEWQHVEEPHHFEVVDRFARDDGSPDDDLPSNRMRFSFRESAAGTSLLVTARFDRLEDLETVTAMGMEEGLREAMSQVDAVVSDPSSFAAGRRTEASLLDETRIRVSRVVRGEVSDVWRAHHEPELVSRWMLGPDGWTMPVCEPAQQVGERYRYEWEPTEGEAGGERFGFTGEILESSPPLREVTTEAMIGNEAVSTLNELTLTPVDGGTLLTLVITYPDRATRDTVLETGMVDGMEFGYLRLEDDVLPSG